MSENKNPVELSARYEKSAAQTMGPVERTMERFMEMGSVEAVYGKPVKHDDTLIIPAAELIGGLGFGMGSGMGVNDEQVNGDEEPGNQEDPWDERKTPDNLDEGEQKTPDKAMVQGADLRIDARGSSGGGGGGGGGGRVFARPVAVIISGPDGVRIEPVVDVTKIALAFITAIGFMASISARMKKGPRRLE